MDLQSPQASHSFEPLSEAESIYLRSRLAMPSVLLGFGLMGLAACIYLLVTEWPEKAYLYLAILIPDVAATWLLFRIFTKLRGDYRGGRKKVVHAVLNEKIRRGENGPFFLVVDKKTYRVTPEAFDQYEAGQKMRVYSSPAAGMWLGFGPD